MTCSSLLTPCFGVRAWILGAWDGGCPSDVFRGRRRSRGGVRSPVALSVVLRWKGSVAGVACDPCCVAGRANRQEQTTWAPLYDMPARAPKVKLSDCLSCFSTCHPLPQSFTCTAGRGQRNGYHPRKARKRCAFCTSGTERWRHARARASASASVNPLFAKCATGRREGTEVHGARCAALGDT